MRVDRAWRVSGRNGGWIFVTPDVATTESGSSIPVLDLTAAAGSRAVTVTVPFASLLEALSEAVRAEPRLLGEDRATCYFSDRCSRTWVPDLRLLAGLLEALADGVERVNAEPTPRYREECEGDERECWLWSPAEAETVKKVVEHLRAAAAELRRLLQPWP